MFGTLRYVLALMVVQAHLIWFNRGMGASGAYAVFGFYTLSGYLIARVLATHYPFTSAGCGRFVANRALRLFPAYLVAVAFAVTVAALVAMARMEVAEIFRVPRGAIEWLRVATIIGLPGILTPDYASVRPVMAAWSLGVEMYFYIMMALGLARGRVIALLWLAAAVLWHAYLFATVPAWQDRYFTVGGGALPFAVGVCLWQFRDALPRLALPVTLGILFAFLAHSQAAGWLWGGYDAARALPLYLSLALVAVSVLGLSQIDPRSVHPRLRRIDTWLGDLAYPIFVLHQAVAIAVWYALGGAPETKWSAYAYSLVPLHIAAIAVVVLVERPLFGLRAKVRHGALRLQDLRLPVGRDQTARNEAV